MKKTLLTILNVFLILAFSSCVNQVNKNAEITSAISETSQSENENSISEQTAADNTTQNSDKKTLVVYFSATGNTREIAEYIASATGGDLFEIIPEKIYSSEDLDWTNNNSRVSYEHDNPTERNVVLKTPNAENFDTYDSVFIGYPIWWGIAAWPVDSFIKANDFTGKTVIPFCTSASSGIGESDTLLRETAGTGMWLDGVRFSSGTSDSELLQWLAELGY